VRLHARALVQRSDRVRACADLPCPVDDDGLFTAVVKDFVGQHCKAADEVRWRWHLCLPKPLTAGHYGVAEGSRAAAETRHVPSQLPVLLAVSSRARVCVCVCVHA
jgi:hypothetical protein